MKTSDLKDALTVEDILGKDVYDEAGEFLGVTNNMYLDEKKMRVLGLSIDKGFIARGLIIGTKYLQRITEHAIFLNARPAYRMRGMTVYDKHGGIVGTVKHVELEEDTNDVTVLHVRRYFKKRTIPIEAVEKMEESVMLKVTRDEL